MSRASAHDRFDCTHLLVRARARVRTTPRRVAPTTPQLLGAIVAFVALFAMAGPAAAGTSLSSAGCTTPAAKSFQQLVAGDAAVTSADCTISFGSSDSTAQLRLRQADGAGAAATRMTDGAADTTFDGDGLRTYDPTTSSDSVSRVLALADGSVLVVGTQGPAPVVPYVLKLDAAGLPVPSFGTAGVATWNVPGGTDDYAYDAAVQADGRIVVVGQNGADNAITRLTSAGALDTTFSGDGFVTFDGGGVFDQANAVAVRPDGRIVVGGNAAFGHGGWVALVDVNGRRETESFGTINGFAVTSLGAQFTIYDLSLAADGGVYVVGANTSSNKPHLARFTRAGVQAVGYGDLTIGSATTSEDVLARPDGSVLMSATGTGTAYVARWTGGGTLDATFGTAGTRQLDPVTGDETITALAADAAGGIVLGLNTFSAGLGDSGIMRLRSDGSDDTRFAGDGHRSWPVHASDHDAFTDVTVTSSGAIVAAGTRTIGAGPDALVSVVRMTGGSIPDYGAGGSWASGSMFGACLRAVSGMGASATWTANATCPATDGAHWNDVPAGVTGAEVASTSVAGVVDASASLRFGARVDSSAAGGTYVAPLVVEVIAPNLDAPVNTVAPTITGPATARKLLRAVNGTWTGSGTLAFSYQWRRCDAAGANCTDIAGASNQTYLLATGDVGSTIRVVVTATNSEGSASATSAQTAAVAAAPAVGLAVLTGFEHGTTDVTGGGVATDIGASGTGTITSETTIVRSGTRAMRFSADAGATRQFNWNIGVATQRSATARHAFNVQSLPTAWNNVSQLEAEAWSGFCEVAVQPSGEMGAYMWDNNTGTSVYQAGPTIDLERWYQVEYSCDMSTTTWRMDWRLDGETMTQLTFPGRTVRWVEQFQTGTDMPAQFDVVIDDVAVSRNIADFPLGPARIDGLRPNGIGSITTPTTWYRSTDDMGTATALAAGDANQSPGWSTLIDEWPVTTGAAADLIEQSLANDQLHVRFQDGPASTDPSAISVIGAQREFITGVNNSTVTAVSSGTAALWSRNPAGGAGALEYYSAVLPTKPAGGAWTLAALAALEVRLSGTDVTPDIWTDALLVEAEYPVDQIARNLTLPTILGSPKVGATLLATTGTWSPDPTAYAYQWKRCNAAGSSCTNIPGATSVTYVPVALDAAGSLRVRVTATTAVGNQAAVSAQTLVVAPGAPTLTFLSGFEHGTMSTAGGGLFSSQINGAVVETPLARNGRFALQATSNGVIESYVDRPASSTVAVTRFAVMFAELPTTSGELAEIQSTGAFSCDLDYNAATNRFEADIENSQASSITVVPGRWYVFDLRCNVSTATHTMEWMIDGVPQTSTSRAAGAAATITEAGLGSGGSTLITGTAYYDDWALSQTSADYPIGAGKVVGLKPSATLAHTTPASFETSTNGASTWTPLTAADDNQNPGSASLLDEWPIQYVAATSGDLVRQVNTAGHLDYALTDAEESGAVNAVRVVGSHHSATPANVQNVELRARLGAGSTTSYSSEVPSGSISYLAGLMNARPGGGAWTGADLDALHLELDSTNVGAAGDRPWTHALLAEADLPVGAMATSVAVPGISLPYDVPKVGDELRVDDGTWSGVPVTGHRYAWLRCNSSGAACVAISGASGSTYTLQAADVGARLRVIDLAVAHAGAQGARSAATELVSTPTSSYYFTGFEHGAASAAGGGLTFQLDPDTSNDAAMARTGNYSLRTASIGSGAEWEVNTPTTDPQATLRFAMYLDTLPASTASLTEISTGSSRFGRMRVAPSGQVSVEFYDTAARAIVVGPTLQTGRWYVVDWRLDGTTATWNMDWRIDGAQQPSTSYAMGSPAAITQIDLGINNSQTMTAHWDDVAYSTIGTDFPIGNGRTYGFAVDGRASGGTPGNFGPAPESAWAAALAELPMTATTTFIEQTAITASATDHVAFTTADPASTQTARAVRGIASYGATAAGTNHVAMRVRRPGDTLAAAPTVFSGNAEVAPLSYAAAMIPPPSGGWTQANLANTDWLVGFSTDVAPAPRVHGLLLEVEYRG